MTRKLYPYSFLVNLDRRALPVRPTVTIRGACDFLPIANAQKYQSAYGGSLVTIDHSGHGLRENQIALESALRQFATGPLAAVELAGLPPNDRDHDWTSAELRDHNRMIRNRKALVITLTDDSAIAAAAIAGDSIHPKAG